MSIVEIAKKLGTLLNGETIYFDHKSYDLAEDIPHIFRDGKRYNVESAKFSNDGTFLRLELSSWSLYAVGLDFNEGEGWTLEDIEKVCEEMGLDALFHDIYYETDHSVEIGDYEVDFLGI